MQPYWLGNYIFDGIFMMFIMVIFLILGLTLPNLDILGKAMAGWMFVLIPACFAVISLSYMLSYRYEKTNGVQKYFLWFVLLWQYLIPQLLISPITISQNK